ncbi:MAG: hypothetical protein NTW38_02520 [Candidatus Aminicenantes bacterium]|nr:hypothetical protein [Candidatus Aminicenantes bacterium]
MALKDKMIPPDPKPDEVLSAEIDRLKEADGTVSCAATIRLAEKTGVKPEEVGRTLDALAVHLSLCQIGIFGYPGHAKGWAAAGAALQLVPDGLIEALEDAGGVEKRITCSEIWKIAAKFRVSRILAGYVADQAGLKIKGCQLGAF